MFSPNLRFLRNPIVFLFLCVFIFLVWNLLEKQDNEYTKCWAKEKSNCGKDETSALLYLPSDETPPTFPFIFFLEGHFHDYLLPRMLCAVESAAVAHPNVTVYVMMTSHYLRMTPITKSVMAKYDNIKFVHLNVVKLFMNSPLQKWFSLERWKTSFWPKSHFTDALRWLLLWKYGGLYLDLDVVVLKNLIPEHEENFAGLESEKWVAMGVVCFTKGHPFVEECLQKLNLTFDGTVWGANGPELFTNHLKYRCGMELPSGKLPKCHDIKLYPPRAFYPIPWWQWYQYITENAELSDELINDPDVLVIHVWNLHTSKYPVPLYESNPYAIAAKNFCPIVVYEVGYRF